MPKFTSEELVVVLEEALSSIEFLYDCLEHPEMSKHAYPEMTRKKINLLRQIVGPRTYCFHSFRVEGCADCVEGNRKRGLLWSVEEKLKESEKGNECSSDLLPG